MLNLFYRLQKFFIPAYRIVDMDTRKKRTLLVEKLSRLHSSVSSFSNSDDNYDQCLNYYPCFSINMASILDLKNFSSLVAKKARGGELISKVLILSYTTRIINDLLLSK